VHPTNYITSRRNELRFLIASKDFRTKKMEYKTNDEKDTVKICANMMAKIAFISFHYNFLLEGTIMRDRASCNVCKVFVNKNQ
jgi:hypothetical protein